MEFFPLVVAKCDSAVVVFDDVIRVDWNFSTASRAVDHVLGDGVARSVATQPLDDFDAFLDTGS